MQEYYNSQIATLARLDSYSNEWLNLEKCNIEIIFKDVFKGC